VDSGHRSKRKQQKLEWQFGLIHTYHAVPMPFPYVMPLRVYSVSFPYDLHSVAVSDSQVSCRAHAVPLHRHADKGLQCVSHMIYTVWPYLIHTYYAVPMPFPYIVMPIEVYSVSFPYDLHSVAVSDSHITCRARAMPRPCRSESDFLRPRYSAAWARHRM
jgi:hypothetical protein